MLKIKRIANQLGNTDGAEIAEAALVLPLVFMLLLGVVWFGRAFNIYSTIQQAAQQGAIAAARDTCATCDNTMFPHFKVDQAVVAVLNASNIDPSQIIKWQANNPNPGLQNCPSPAPVKYCSTTNNKIWVCSSVLLNTSSQPAQCGAMVSFQYPFSFYLPYTSINLQQVVMSAQAQSRMEN